MHPITPPYSNQRALVVEGGGMRGVFAAGVLDAFHDKRLLRQFKACYGVSAGALNLTSFLSGQRGRNLHIYTGICRESQFISLARFLRGGHLFDLDFFFEKINRQSSLNNYRFQQALAKTRFCVVSTCIKTGTPHYIDIHPDTKADRLVQSLKASSALPMIYRNPVLIDHKQLMDGSLSDPLPFSKALEDGFRNILLIRTRPIDHQKKAYPSGRLMAWQYRNKPAIAKLIRQQTNIYNHTLDNLNLINQKEDIHITQIAPPTPLNSSRSTQDRTKLVADYHLGYAEGYAAAEKLNKMTASDLLD